MKKSKFIALVIGVIGTLLLGVGMCMCTIASWDMQREGIIVGVIGLLTLLAMVIVYRKMEKKAPIQVNRKTVLTVLFGVVGTLGLGAGMSLAMVFGQFIIGIIIGMISIMILLCLVPLTVGLK